MVQCDRLNQGEDDCMAMLDGTKIFPDTVVINGSTMNVFIIGTVSLVIPSSRLTLCEK